MSERAKRRLALITLLAKTSPRGHIGRTALMKYIYFLQVLKNCDLGHTFSMYSYGPFDSDVLADLDTAENLGAITASLVQFNGGYGYQIRPGASSAQILEENKKFLEGIRDFVADLFRLFRDLNTAELELESTIIYVDREFKDEGEVRAGVDEISTRVNEIKPHFGRPLVVHHVRRLFEMGLLTSVLMSTTTH